MEEESFGADQTDMAMDNVLNPNQYSSLLSGPAELGGTRESYVEDRPYKCNQCDKSYRHAGSLVNHKKTHQVGLYICLICQKEFSNPMGLKSHLRTHSEDKRFKCEQCGEAFRMSQQLYNHRRSTHGFLPVSSMESLARNHKGDAQAPIPVDSSNLISNLENYIAESMVPGDFSELVSKYYQDGSSPTEESYKDDVLAQQESAEETREEQTVNEGNTEDYRYKCNQCSKAYKHAGSLANHRQSHMVGSYQCAICFKEFSNLMAMKNHCRLHSDSRARQRCKSPRYSVKTEGPLLEDTDALQSDTFNPSDSMDNLPTVSGVFENSKCEEQGENVPSPVQKFQDDPYSDSLCAEQTLQVSSKDSMIKVEENPLEEEETSQQPAQEQSKESLDDDCRPGDLENRPFRCQECGKTYRHAGSLINHKKTHQTGVYSCSLCSKQMYNVAALNNHFRAHFKSRTERKGEENYFESANFSDYFQNTEDPFLCRICGEYLPNEMDFLQHQVLHHEKAIKETYSDVRNAEEELEPAVYWPENPQISQSNGDASDTSVPNPVKIEMEDIAQQQMQHRWPQEETFTRPLDETPQNNGAKIEGASGDFVEATLDQTMFKEASPLEGQDKSPGDRPYKCEPCGRTYRHKSSLINHKLTHNTGTYQCSLCPKQYSNLMALRNHHRFHSHSNAGRKGLLSKRRSRHLRGGPIFIPKKSESVKLHENRSPKTHSDTAVGRTSTQISCSCGESFDCMEGFQCHSQICLNSTPVTCSTEPPIALKKEETLLTDSQHANKTTPKPESQMKVLEASEHSSGRVYECDLCNKSYRHSGSLINHKRTHQTGDYMCPYCSRHVHNMAALKNHIRIHHKGKRNQPGDMLDSSRFMYPDLCYPQGAKEFFGCVSCEEIFHSEDDLVAHQMVHMALEEDQWEQKVQESNTAEDNKSLSLEKVCDSSWERSNNSDVHEAEDDGNGELIAEYNNHIDYTCIECGEVYSSIEELNNHKLTHQIGIYQCSFCPKEYPNLPALRDHFRSHTKPQALRNVGKDHSDGTELEEIVEDQQTFESQYDCGHCGLVFSSEADFHQHQVGHEKQAAESLPILDEGGKETEFSFAMVSSERELLRRIKNELEGADHTDTPDGGTQLSHICGFCGQTYDDLESLQAHSLSHVGEEKPLLNENLDGVEEHQDTLQHALMEKKEENSEETARNEENQENRPYTCDQCGKSYRHGGSLVNHKKTHLVGNFQCAACSKRYPNMAAYINHLRHHPQCKQRVAVKVQHELQASDLQNSSYTTGDGVYINFSSSLSAALPNSSVSHSLPSDFKPCIDTLSINNSCLDYSSTQKRFQTPERRVKQSRKPCSRQVKKRRAPMTSTPLAGRPISDMGVSNLDEESMMSCEFSGKTFGVKSLSLHMDGDCKNSGETALVKQFVEPVQADDEEIPTLGSSGYNQDAGGFHQRPFRCEVCNRSYRHAGSLINHKQTHKTGLFRCSICQKQFFNLMAMKNHNRIHFELKRHKCLDCGKAFRLIKQLETHQRLHWQRTAVRKSGRRNRRSTRCRKFAQTQQRKATSLCEDVAVDQTDSSGKQNAESFIKREIDPDSCRYRCEECGRSYRHASSLFNHKKSHKVGQYCCPVCHKKYSNLMAMKNHERIHYASKRHNCLQCGKTFKWKRQLTKHQFVHAQEGFQSVSQQPKEEIKATIQDNHEAERSAGLRKRSRKSSSPITNLKKQQRYFENKESSTNEPVCTACGVSFSNSEDLTNHSCNESRITTQDSGNDELGKSTLSKEEAERPFACEVCGRTYRHAGSLLNHKNTHKNGLYKCSLCNKQFFNPMAIKNHLRAHKAKKKFQCMECGRAFRSSQELVCHVSVHTSVGTFHCTICNRGFSSKLKLKHHQRTHKNSNSLRSSSPAVPSDVETNIHESNISDPCKVEPAQDFSPTQEKKYKCSQCDRSYRHAGSLFNHKKTHRTGVYKCPNCLKEFFNLLAYKNHLRIHKYPCKDCGKAFRIAGHLVAHRKIHEQEGSLICPVCDKCFFSESSFEDHKLTHNGQASDTLEPSLVSNIMVEAT